MILNVPVGTYELRAQRIGFATGAAVTVRGGSINQLHLPQARGLDGIVVTGTAGIAPP